MFKNVTGQKLTVFAFDSTTNLPKSGDAANILAYVSKDNGTVLALGDITATEMDAVNAKGYYLFDLTQAETNGDKLQFSAKSSTANIVVLGVPAVVYAVIVDGNNLPMVDVEDWVQAPVDPPLTSGVPTVFAYPSIRKLSTAAGGSISTITLPTLGSSTIDQAYRGIRVVLPAITGGVGAGQARIIKDYIGATKVATIFPNWIVAPDNTSKFYLETAAVDVEAISGSTDAVSLGAGGLLNVNSGTSTASAVDALLSANHGAGAWGGLNISLNPNLSTAINLTASADFAVFNDANWTQTITITGMVSTGWTQMVLTIKADANADSDAAALAMVRVSNPGVGGDGILVSKGAPAADPTQASIVVNTITPDTQVTWNLSAAAMDLPASATPPYSWELARWKGAVKDIIAGGKLVVKRSVRRATTAP